MSKKVKDICVSVGTYQNQGETKNRYARVGALMEGSDGQYIILERHFNPAGVVNPDNRPNLILSMFEPRETAQATHNQGMAQANQAMQPAPQQNTSHPTPTDGFEDSEIPFANPYKGIEFIV